MTNHWNDLQHADIVLVMGANPAENHPISFKWILKAKEKGGKLISVDPRFSRTSVLSDLYAPLRSGTDIAFLGGMIKYIIDTTMYFEEYVKNYTNAAFIVGDGYDFNDGIFSGYNEEKRSYDRLKWAFKTVPALDPVTQQPILDPVTKLPVMKTATDPTLQDPRCVFQLMKKHYSRYDIETVSKTTGTPVEQLKQVYELYSSTGRKDKAGTMLYAMGITQHTVGSENVRIMAMVQLLLGNIGIAGGGVNALRGESNVQGSTDFGLLYGNTTGYMETPTATLGDSTWDGFMGRITPKTGFFSNKSKFYVALQKSFYGKNATLENQWGYNYLPKLTAGKDYSHMRVFEAIAAGTIEGAFVWGANPIVGGPNASKEKSALANLKWMVVADLWEHETSVFWSEEAGSNPKEIQTEMFFLPACGSFEKEGTVSNSGRWMQYRWEALHPRGESKPDLEMVHNIALKVKELYKNSTNPNDAAVNALTWDFGGEGHPEFDKVAREINGYDLSTGKLLTGFGVMTTPEAVLGNYSAGNWIYTGFYCGVKQADGTIKEVNKSKNRDNTDKGIGNFLNWSFAWPANRRILYNRASCDLAGNPYNPDKVVIKWGGGKDAVTGAPLWGGNDVPDFAPTKAPDIADGSGKKPFIMTPSLVGNLYAPMNEGPFPEHYEPWESPATNNFSSVEFNPAVKAPAKGFDQRGTADKFPIVATTYRVSEHWQTGSMTRNQEWLSELVNHMFVELSEELAKEKGIKHKEKVVISSARGEIEVYAMVTKRLKPHTVNGKTVHEIGMPWQFGFKGYAKGASANTLTPHIGDANTSIPEYKAFLCDVRRVK